MEPDDPEIYFLRHSKAEDWAGRTPLIIVDSVLSPKATFPGCGRRSRKLILPSR